MDEDAVSLIEGDSLVESGEHTGSFFIREERGKSQARMIIDGDVKGFDTGAWIAMRTVAGGADAWLEKTAKLFNIKMKELAWSGAFVAQSGRPGRVEGGEAIETMAAQDAGKSGLGDRQSQEDLSVGTALTSESQDLIFQERRSLAWLAKGDGRAIIEAPREVGLLGAFEPFADGFFGDGEGGGASAEGAASGEEMSDHFGSHEWSECGISVHSDREGWLGVERASTTNLPDPRSADNVLKHDT